MDIPTTLIYHKSNRGYPISITIMFLFALIIMLGIAIYRGNLRTMIVPAIFIVPGYIFGMIALTISAINDRGIERYAIEKFLREQVWLHWQISLEEWKAHAPGRLAVGLNKVKMRNFLARIPQYGRFIGLAVVLYVLRINEWGPFTLPLFGTLLALTTILTAVAWIDEARMTRARYAKAMDTTPRVYFGPHAVYHEIYGYIPLGTVWDSKHALNENPPQIVLTILQSADHPTALGFLIPRGQEQEAVTLVERYQREQLSDPVQDKDIGAISIEEEYFY
jgi:hypothetical protein